MYRLCQEIW